MFGRLATPWTLVGLLGAFPGSIAGQSIHYVDADATGAGTGASWADAFTDLRAGLAAASPGDEVWVAEGTYKPDGGTGDKQLSFDLVEGVAIYGGFGGGETSLAQRDPTVHVVTLSGDLLGNDMPASPKWKDNSRHIVKILPSSPFPPAILDGLTIVGGTATGSEENGGGLISIDASLVVRTCCFTDNRALLYGGGMYVEGGSLVIDDSTFERCDVTSAAGTSPGAVMALNTASCEVLNSKFLNNAGGALALLVTTGTIERCLVAGNVAPLGGGGVSVSALPEGVAIRDCVIVGNQTTMFSGAGILAGGPVEIVRCTISENVCGPLGAGAGISIGDGASVVISDSIVWGNKATDPIDAYFAQILPFGTPSITITFSIVEGWQPSWPGHGTFDVDPAFVDPPGPDLILGTADDDWTLTAGSPAIDSANPTTQAASFDLLGNPRTLDGELDGVAFVDRGALEFAPARLTAEPATVLPGGSTQLSVNGIVGLPSFLLIGLAGPPTLIGPYGVAGIDLAMPWIILPWGPVPATGPIHVPSWFASGWDLALQAVVVDVGTQAAALTNVVTLEFD